MKPEVGGISEEKDLKEKQALIFCMVVLWIVTPFGLVGRYQHTASIFGAENCKSIWHYCPEDCQ
jgi:hypothetical protein